MTDTILPAFPRHSEEAAIIGRLLAGYGELELAMTHCVGAHLPDLQTAINTLFGVRGESARIIVADALIRNPITALNLRNEYAEALGAIRTCLKIRNQFAHCHWNEDNFGRLQFVDLQSNIPTPYPLDFNFHNIDLRLLTEQEGYFVYTLRCFRFIHHGGDLRLGRIMAHPFSMPPRRLKPNLHSP